MFKKHPIKASHFVYKNILYLPETRALKITNFHAFNIYQSIKIKAFVERNIFEKYFN